MFPALMQNGVPTLTVGNVLPERVRLLVSGPGKDLLRLNADHFRLRIQAQGRANEVGSYKQKLEVGDVESDPTELDVQIKDILDPTELEIALDRRVERNINWNRPKHIRRWEVYTSNPRK